MKKKEEKQEMHHQLEKKKKEKKQIKKKMKVTTNFQSMWHSNSINKSKNTFDGIIFEIVKKNI